VSRRTDARLRGLGQLLAALHEARGRRREALARARAEFVDEAVFPDDRGLARASGLRFAIGAVVLFALVGAAFVVWQGKRTQPPSFVANAAVSGQAVAVTVGRWLWAPETEDVLLSFSDGSRFTLRAGSRARLAALSPIGGRITLERGEVQGAVPIKGATWIVQAGPIDVAFSESVGAVLWDPPIERVTLDVSEGRISVSGGCVGDEAKVYAKGAHHLFDCLEPSF